MKTENYKKEEIYKLSNSVELKDIIEKIEFLNDIVTRLDYNINANMFIDKLIVNWQVCMKTYGVIFKENGKEYKFSSKELFDNGTKVIVDTERGQQLGTIKNSYEKENTKNLKKIKRIAGKEDIEKYKKNIKRFTSNNTNANFKRNQNLRYKR